MQWFVFGQKDSNALRERKRSVSSMLLSRFFEKSFTYRTVLALFQSLFRT